MWDTSTRRAYAATLARPDLRFVVRARRLSEAVSASIRQNLALALVYNVLCVPLAAVGLVTPIWAAAAMSFSSLSVVGNSLRLRRKRLGEKTGRPQRQQETSHFTQTSFVGRVETEP